MVNNANARKYIKNLLIYSLVKIYYKKADLIISNSKSGKKDLAKLVTKAMFGGALASWLTATIAGILI